ncbi:MAG: cob(I)yrinic acid a,c-diamide adenosyltransferase [Bacillota bacterium]|nr:cob(I)yrinic acid a,c-diamide adenosyltransferase [Bacillota bacterium]
MCLERGYIQIYTGNGKGKTTAALGLALRALCAGFKVYIGQFAKGQNYSELKAPEIFENLTMEQYGEPTFIVDKPSSKDIERAEQGFKKAYNAVTGGEYDLVILDEINIAVLLDLIPVEKVLNMLDKKCIKTEVILTGRYANEALIEKADLVTEMKEIKHYYNSGITARRGIEN